MKLLIPIVLFISALLISSHGNSQSIKKYTESASNFDRSPELTTDKYPDSILYRAYVKGGSAFRPTASLKTKLENKIRAFATKNDKNFVVVGQRIQNGGMGVFPKIEIIFALVPKN